MKRKALYLPEELHRKLQLIAERENRTMVLQIKNWVDVFVGRTISERVLEEMNND